jgi:dihydroorotase-like cyclic amidohydrolase
VLWHLNPKKGSIQLGADADFAIIDPVREWTLDSQDLLHAQKWSPFEGRSFHGKVIKTILRGEVIFDAYKPNPITVDPGFGQFLRPQ